MSQELEGFEQTIGINTHLKFGVRQGDPVRYTPAGVLKFRKHWAS
jgi:hypothetical protein